MSQVGCITTYTHDLTVAHVSIEDSTGDCHCEEERHQEAKQGEQGASGQLHTDAVDVQEDPKSNYIEVEAYLPADDRHIAVSKNR